MGIKEIIIVKIGGGILNDAYKTSAFLSQFAKIKVPKILVHGGGRTASAWAKRLNIPQQMVEGKRVTSAETLEVVTMVYGGLISKKITAQLVAKNQNALGLCGIDSGLVHSKKRPVKAINYGFVGDIVHIDTHKLRLLLKMGFTPIIGSLTQDQKGQILNTNADTLAAEIARALSEHHPCKLFFCLDRKGVESQGKVLPQINLKQYKQLKDFGEIHSGMIPKLENALSVAHSGLLEVRILNGLDLSKQLEGIKDYGTKVS